MNGSKIMEDVQWCEPYCTKYPKTEMWCCCGANDSCNGTPDLCNKHCREWHDGCCPKTYAIDNFIQY